MADQNIEQQRALAIAEATLKLQKPQQGSQPSAGTQFPFTPSGERPGFLSNMATALTSPQLAGGPMAMAGREGVRQVDELMDKGAYSAGGAVTDIASQAGASPEVAGGAGYAANVGVRAIPMLVGGLAGKALEPVTRNAPVIGSRDMMQSAMKPSSKDLASGDAAKAIDTMLERGFNVTPEGVSKMRGLVKQLSGEVDDMIKASPESMNKDAVRQEIVAQLKKFRGQVNPNADVKAILKSWDEFRHTVGQDIPVQQAQALKQGTYKILADKYAHMGTVGDEAGTQAQMAMARGLRKGIEQKVPGVVAPNKEMSELINAMEIAERRAGIAGNRDIAGIAWLAEHPAAATGMLADRSPWIKSLIARLMHSGMPATGAAAGAAYGNYDQLMRDQQQP